MKKYLLNLLFLVAITSVQATIKLPALISDNMVLQQHSTITLWGWAAAGEVVTIQPSWQNKSTSVTADATGNWQVKVKTLGAGGPYRISFSASNTITVNNVLFGEVWLASGQSNMEFFVGKGGGWKTGAHNYLTEIPQANYPNIRMIDVPNLVADTLKNDFIGTWQVCDTGTIKDFSAVAYFFSKELFLQTNYPIGIINATWGGTPAESWTKKAVLESDTGFRHILDRYQKLLDDYPAAYERYKADKAAWKADTTKKKPAEPLGASWNKSPSKLYNGMIAPLLNYMIKGVIWYQGESNAEHAWQYRRLFPAMIKSWRSDWHQPGLPFYFVQISMHKGQNAEIREAQLYTWQTVPHTGMVVTTDYGDTNNIHPRNKEVVGKRLALWALHNEYGKKELITSGPVYKSMQVEGNKIILSFDFSAGLHAKQGSFHQFTIAAKDSGFVQAQATIKDNKVVVWSDAVPNPEAVRYGWQNLPVAELYNSSGLPATPFRTDSRRVTTQGVE